MENWPEWSICNLKCNRYSLYSGKAGLNMIKTVFLGKKKDRNKLPTYRLLNPQINLTQHEGYNHNLKAKILQPLSIGNPKSLLRKICWKNNKTLKRNVESEPLAIEK
jgi:hypothetical protein